MLGALLTLLCSFLTFRLGMRANARAVRMQHQMQSLPPAVARHAERSAGLPCQQPSVGTCLNDDCPCQDMWSEPPTGDERTFATDAEAQEWGEAEGRRLHELAMNPPQPLPVARRNEQGAASVLARSGVSSAALMATSLSNPRSYTMSNSQGELLYRGVTTCRWCEEEQRQAALPRARYQPMRCAEGHLINPEYAHAEMRKPCGCPSMFGMLGRP